jgi:SulP family sulfate permease
VGKFLEWYKKYINRLIWEVKILLKPKLFSIIKHRDTELSSKQLLTEVISGIIVAIIALPLSIALGIASGVPPQRGLITAIVAGFFIALLGGSRVQIGGPTAAFAIIICGVIQK